MDKNKLKDIEKMVDDAALERGALDQLPSDERDLYFSLTGRDSRRQTTRVLITKYLSLQLLRPIIWYQWRKAFPGKLMVTQHPEAALYFQKYRNVRKALFRQILSGCESFLW